METVTLGFGHVEELSVILRYFSVIRENLSVAELLHLTISFVLFIYLFFPFYCIYNQNKKHIYINMNNLMSSNVEAIPLNVKPSSTVRI